MVRASVFTEQDKALMVKLFKQGYFYTEIATQVKQKRSTVISWMQRQREFEDWCERFRRPRKKHVRPNRELLYAPNLMRTAEECPQCHKLVRLSGEPNAPCLPCQLRGAKRGALVV